MDGAESYLWINLAFSGDQFHIFSGTYTNGLVFIFDEREEENDIDLSTSLLALLALHRRRFRLDPLPSSCTYRCIEEKSPTAVGGVGQAGEQARAVKNTILSLPLFRFCNMTRCCIHR